MKAKLLPTTLKVSRSVFYETKQAHAPNYITYENILTYKILLDKHLSYDLMPLESKNVTFILHIHTHTRS